MLHIFSRLKKVLLILLVIFITGCSAEYTITVNDNTNINELLDVIEKDDTTFNIKKSSLYNTTPKEYLNTNLKWPTSVYIDMETSPLEPIKSNEIYYYNKKDISNNFQLGINYSFEHSQYRYGKSTIANNCYSYEYQKIDDKLLFETKDSFKCFDKYDALDSVKINLVTNCKVINENADSKTKNKYTWKIEKNKTNQKIIFSLDCSKKEQLDHNFRIPLVVLCYIAFFAFITMVVFVLNKKNNRL